MVIDKCKDTHSRMTARLPALIQKRNHKWKMILDTLTEMLAKGGKAVKTAECLGNQYYLQGQAPGVSHLSSLINGRSAPQTLSKCKERAGA